MTISTGGKSRKWQPLAAVDPYPVGEHNSSSLGNRDDEKETKNKDSNADEGGRVKQATTEAIAGEIGSSSKDDIFLKYLFPFTTLLQHAHTTQRKGGHIIS